MNDTIVVPEFASESEEADWWFDHRHEHDKIMGRAMEAGRTMNLRELLKKRGVESAALASQEEPDLIGTQAKVRGPGAEERKSGSA